MKKYTSLTNQWIVIRCKSYSMIKVSNGITIYSNDDTCTYLPLKKGDMVECDKEFNIEGIFNNDNKLRADKVIGRK